MDRELVALNAITFSAYEAADDVWREDLVHVEGMHEEAWTNVVRLHNALKRGQDGDNVVIQGRPGLGKTHFIGRLRSHTIGNSDVFVLVQLSSSRDFWPSLVMSVVDSLNRPVAGGSTQVKALLGVFLSSAGVSQDVLPQLGDPDLAPDKVKDIRRAIDRKFSRLSVDRIALEVTIALALVSYGDFHASDIGDSYLMGIEIDEEDRRLFGFRRLVATPRQIVQALCRLVELSGKVAIVAVDQLDGLIAMASAEQVDEGGEQGLLDRTATGLMDLAEDNPLHLIVVSCLAVTWSRIESQAVQSAAARYGVPLRLRQVPSAQVGADLIAAYFARGFRRADFVPPYSTWPIHPEAFVSAHEYSPRDLLNIANAHLRMCRQQGYVTELKSLAPSEPPPTTKTSPGTAQGTTVEPPTNDQTVIVAIDGEYQSALRRTKTIKDWDEVSELLLAALGAWVHENELGDSFRPDAPPGKDPPLHARLRQMVNPGTEEEVHWSFRAIPHTNAVAALNRLRKAITASGLGMAGMRHLVVIRDDPWPRGTRTEEALKELVDKGGRVLPLSADDVRVLGALVTLWKKHEQDLIPWLRARRPASGTKLLTEVLGHLVTEGPAVDGVVGLPGGGGGEPAVQVKGPPSQGQGPSTRATVTPATDKGPTAQEQGSREPPKKVPEIVTLPSEPSIPLGTSAGSGRTVFLRLEQLRRHAVVFAGSGSGKTVLIRRLIEECALQGVSSIVLDPNNDIARLGTPWPEPPDHWVDGDGDKAARYFAETETIIWTPRLNRGRPLAFQPLGDLAAVKDDAEDLRIAVENAVATLLPRAGLPKTGKKLTQGKAILIEALKDFALHGGTGLKGFLSYLNDLPDGVSQLANAQKQASDMAQTLMAATVNDPLFGGEGETIDPGVLLTPADGKRARVSVISLVGLPNDDQRQSFVNQLQLALFAWAKKNPAGDRPLGGLFVMDEAQIFASSSGDSPSLRSTLALASQARKYGLGLLFATQAPKGLHNQIPGNATTQFYGLMNAPAQAAAVRDMARLKGGDVPDISRLGPGRFYAASDVVALQKLNTPMCLSHHPRSPLNQEEILALAQMR